MIKPVEEIPQTVREERISRRRMLQKDMSEAINAGITKFEFEGDYNYKYLAQYAREEADHILNKILRERWEREPRQPYEGEEGCRSWPVYYDRHIRGKKYIIIHNVKREDRNHVYCEIIPEALDEMIEAHKQHLAEMEEQRKEREKKKQEWASEVSMEHESRRTNVRNLIRVKEGVK